MSLCKLAMLFGAASILPNVNAEDSSLYEVAATGESSGELDASLGCTIYSSYSYIYYGSLCGG